MTAEAPLDWERIVDQHAQRVFRVALRILGSVPDAEDVSQDVFTEAFQSFQSGRVHSWTGLLVRLATVRSIDRLRRKRPSVELRESDRVSTVEPYDEAAAAELSLWLQTAISHLPGQQATVFVMFHYEQLPRDQIAANLGISPDGVSAALYKARQGLLSQLAVFSPGDSR